MCVRVCETCISEFIRGCLCVRLVFSTLHNNVPVVSVVFPGK